MNKVGAIHFLFVKKVVKGIFLLTIHSSLLRTPRDLRLGLVIASEPGNRFRVRRWPQAMWDPRDSDGDTFLFNVRRLQWSRCPLMLSLRCQKGTISSRLPTRFHVFGTLRSAMTAPSFSYSGHCSRQHPKWCHAGHA